MSETIQNQEQPETTLPAEQPEGETPAPDETTTTTAPGSEEATTTPEDTTPMTIGGGLVDRNEDGVEETTEFPVSEVPSPAPEAEVAPEQSTPEASPPVVKAEPRTTETTELPSPSETEIDLTEAETISETVAEQSVKPEAPTNSMEVAPAVGLASLPLLAAAGVKRFRNRGNKS